MKKGYDHAKIEQKWQKKWGLNRYKTPDTKRGADNFYFLTEFPYPSGNLHVGHWYAFSVPDILARFLRMKGKNVLFPIGFDAFGLPAENAALKRGLNPRTWTEGNIAYMRKQLRSMGASFDWSREVVTCDPSYYRWTQWLFLQLFKRGLVYRKKTPVNWCPSCKTVLANEQVKDEKCERCDTEVEQKQMEQWNIKITAYAERLLADLEKLDWPEEIKAAQRNWIGKSEGAEIEFQIKRNPTPTLPKGKGEVYGYHTTSPEHFKLLHTKAVEMRNHPTEAEEKLWRMLRNNQNDYHFRQQHIIDRFIVDFVCLSKSLVIEIDGDIHDVQKERDEERTSILKMLGFEIIRFKNEEVLKDVEKVVEKIIKKLYTLPEKKVLPFGEDIGGVDLEKIKVFTTRPDTLFGVSFVALAPSHPLAKEAGNLRAVNPANGEEVPIFVADYVLDDYGTGAVMGVPAHDERDFAFAKERGLPIKEVVLPFIVDRRNPPKEGKSVVERNNVHAIVRDPKTNKYLALKWHRFDWTTFPMGGMEAGEDAVAAARREVREETGFVNLKLVRVLDGRAKATYFAAHKDENRVSYTTAVLFDLVDDTREKISEKEQTEHDTVWITREQFNYAEMTHAEVELWDRKLRAENGAYTESGILVNSGRFSGMKSEDAKREITKAVGGKMATSYKLRDWVVSRQRYWGVPIPLIKCERCGWVAVPENKLPVKLPEIKDYVPTGDGKSPLAKVQKWVETKCPQCKGKAERETDTLDTFVDSSWYFLRYTDSKNKKEFASRKKMDAWLPVDFYSGGAEHTTMHLLYSRFWHKALFDAGLVADTEPYVKRMNRGLILGPDGQKMSKSRGNVVDPDAEVAQVGADVVRMYLAFIGPYAETGSYPWDKGGIAGIRRFLERVWRLQSRVQNPPPRSPSFIKGGGRGEDLNKNILLNQTIKKVGEDIAAQKFNTAISALMVLTNTVEKELYISREDFATLLTLLAPFAPHLAEELWSANKFKGSVHTQPWPAYDEAQTREESVTIIVQINGKVRGSFSASRGIAEADAFSRAGALPEVQKHLGDKPISKRFFVKDRLVNLVAG